MSETDVRGHPSTAARRRFGKMRAEGPLPADRPPAHVLPGFAAGIEGEPEAARTRARRASSRTAPARRAPARRPAPPRRPIPRRAVRRVFAPATVPGGQLVSPSAPQQVIMAEFVAYMLIVILRGLADYKPADDESLPGTVETPKGLGPFVLAAAGAGWFFVLSLAAAGHRRIGTMAAWLGAATLVTLLFNSHEELGRVAKWIESLGQWSPAAPQAPTVTPVPSAPSAPGGGGGGAPSPAAPPGWRVVPNTQGMEVYAQNGKCPPGWTHYNDRCIAYVPLPKPLM